MKGRDIVEDLGNQIPDTEVPHEGFSRSTFLKYFLFLLAMATVFGLMLVCAGRKYMKEIFILAITLILPIFFWAAAQRLKNIGMKQTWCTLFLVPLINYFLLSGCLVCPKGYWETKKLDRAGRVSAVIIAILTAVLLLVGMSGLARG